MPEVPRHDDDTDDLESFERDEKMMEEEAAQVYIVNFIVFVSVKCHL